MSPLTKLFVVLLVFLSLLLTAATVVYINKEDIQKKALSDTKAGLFICDVMGHGVRAALGTAMVRALLEGVRGLADGCRAFNAPVTGGNCSLYNQSPNGPIDPTPTVAVVGIVEKPEHVTTQWFKDEGDAIILLGELLDQQDPLFGLGGSAYLKCIHGLKTGTPPRLDGGDLRKRKNARAN